MRLVIGGGWRSGLSVAGASLSILPLLQGDWLAAVVAGYSGLMMVGAWAWGTSSGRKAGMTVGMGLVAILAAVFVVSQWPQSNLINAHWFDWFAIWLLIGVGCMAALVVDWTVRGRDGLVRSGPFAGTPARQLVRAMALVATVALVCGCCMFVIALDENDGAWRFEPRASEILPLPQTLRLISADQCTGGTSGNCHLRFVVVATDGAARAVTVERLVAHLRRLGWPLQPAHGAYSGCREIGGILPWTSHCLVLDADPAPGQPPTHPDAVSTHIDNDG